MRQFVFIFFQILKKDIIGSGTLQKAIRFLKDTIDSADNLIGIHTHRTPISLKAYCLIKS